MLHVMIISTTLLAGFTTTLKDTKKNHTNVQQTLSKCVQTKLKVVSKVESGDRPCRRVEKASDPKFFQSRSMGRVGICTLYIG